jgi:glycerophosphoryl diester phosphodiesterase
MAAQPIYFQAHRGAIDEAPENTLVAYEHAWRIPGAIPEVDVRTTADGTLVCLHDATLARTTHAPAPLAQRPISTLSLAEVRRWQAGADFPTSSTAEQQSNLTIPTLTEVLDALVQTPDRRLYVEMKAAAVDQVVALLADYHVLARVIFISGAASVLEEIQAVLPGAPAMTWIGGDAETIPARFEQALAHGLPPISQLQLHLPATSQAGQVTYQLPPTFLAHVQRELTQRGIDLQLRPFAFTPPSLAELLRLGVTWYVADAPAAFRHCLDAAIKEL